MLFLKNYRILNTKGILLDKYQLEKYLEKLASDHVLKEKSDKNTYPIPRLISNFEVITTVYNLLNVSKIDFVPLYDNLYERSIVEEKFRAFLTNNLEITENHFGYIFVSAEDLQKYSVEATSVSNQVNDFYFIKELLCWMFVVYDERNDIYKANIRSRGPVINEIASKYNGGGHKFASGCRSKDYKDMEKLAKDLDEACKEFISKENN